MRETRVLSNSILRGTPFKETIDPKTGEHRIEDKNWFLRCCDPLNSLRCLSWPKPGEAFDKIDGTETLKGTRLDVLKSYEGSTWKKVIFKAIHWLPIINYFYFTFYQKSPGDFVMMVTVESLGEVGLLVGTVAALFYTVMTAMPTSVSWDEFDAVDRHWQSTTRAQWANFTSGVKGCEGIITEAFSTAAGRADDPYNNARCWKALVGKNADGKDWEKTDDNFKVTRYTTDADSIVIGKYGCVIEPGDAMPWRPMSVRIANQMSDSANWLLFSVILSVVFVISAQSLSRVQGSENQDAVEAWFFFGRWVILASVLMLVFGAIAAVSVIGDVMYVKFPHMWLEELCKDHGWTRVGDEFPTQTEIAAEMYTGGRFVQYISAADFERWNTKVIERGGLSSPIEDLDPMRQNGQSYILMIAFTIAAVVLCGYGAACADTQSKEELKKKLNEEQEKSSSTVGNTFAPTEVVIADYTTDNTVVNEEGFGFGAATTKGEGSKGDW